MQPGRDPPLPPETNQCRIATVAQDVSSPTHYSYGPSLWGVGDRVWLETATPPVLGKENGRQAVNAPASPFQVGAGFRLGPGWNHK
jgi:hypothetical protein